MRPMCEADREIRDGHDGEEAFLRRRFMLDALGNPVGTTRKRSASSYPLAELRESLETPLLDVTPLTQCGTDNRKSDKSTIPESGENHIETELSLEGVRRKMLFHGFCSHHIESLIKAYSLDTLREMAKIDKRLHRPADHRPCLTQPACIAFNADMVNYQQSHTSDCGLSDCYPVGANPDDLLQIIKAGGVPLMQLCRNIAGTKYWLKVSKRSWRCRYTTISHVWADGLGNPNGNGLPLCQLQRISTLLGTRTCLYSDRFWMDTLCIPTNPKYMHLRQACIDSMASIYASSRKVIVLDKELMGTSLSTSEHDAADLYQLSDELTAYVVETGLEYWARDREDALYRIACSTWMCRSWTLQEVVLPEDCVFCFNGAIGMPFAKRPHRLFYFSDIERNLCEKFEQRHVFANSKHFAFSNSKHFAFVWNELASRSTTKADDLYIVLASCLNLKPKQLESVQLYEEKMRRIICSLDSLPLGLLFNSGPRSFGSNKWIPTGISSEDIRGDGSLMHLPNTRMSTNSEQGRSIRLEWSDDVNIHTTKGLGSTAQDFVMHTSANRYYQIILLSRPHENLRFADDTKLVIVSEKEKIQDSCVFRGCLFSIKSENPCELEYHCPLHLVMLTVDSSSLSSYDLDGQKVEPRRFDAQMQYDPTPVFKPIQRRNAQSIVAELVDRKASEIGVSYWVKALLFSLCYITLGLEIGTVVLLAILQHGPRVFFLAVDYIFLWGSYDDNTVFSRGQRQLDTSTAFALFVIGRGWKCIYRMLSFRPGRRNRGDIQVQGGDSG